MATNSTFHAPAVAGEAPARSLRASANAPRFIDTIASEWTKLISLRSTYLTLGLVALLSVGMTALICAAMGDSLKTDQGSMVYDPISWSFNGLFFSTIVIAILGVNSTAAEYASGQMRLTLMATPRRGEVLAAKAVVIAGITGVVGVITTVAMFVVGQAILGGYDVETAGITDPDAIRAIVAVSLMVPVFPLLGIGAAVLLRSTGGAITTVLGVGFVPHLFAPLLPAWWQENVMSNLPSQAAESVMFGHLTSAPATGHEPLVGAVVVVAWLAAVLGAAYLALRTRDC